MRRICNNVASLAEAWIEIFCSSNVFGGSMSPPSRRRGLKYKKMGTKYAIETVASLAEAWIEISRFTLSIMR